MTISKLKNGRWLVSSSQRFQWSCLGALPLTFSRCWQTVPLTFSRCLPDIWHKRYNEWYLILYGYPHYFIDFACERFNRNAEDWGIIFNVNIKLWLIVYWIFCQKFTFWWKQFTIHYITIHFAINLLSRAIAGRVLWNRVCLSFHPSV